MVAAHPWDLRAAATHGLRTAYIERAGEGDPDPSDRFDLTGPRPGGPRHPPAHCLIRIAALAAGRPDVRNHASVATSPGPGWKVEQPQPGIFRWTLPSGRTHTTHPTTY
jgi:hypothetical protein